METARSSQNPGVAPDPFDALYARTFPRVWNALGRLGIWSAAERHELAQDVYVVVHQKLPTRNAGAPELAWVLTITRNVAQNHRALLRTRRETLMDDPDAAPEPASDDATPEADLARRQYLALLDVLRPERREVFELHEVEGLTLAEIAEALGKPEGTISSRLRAAREDLDAAVARLKAREKRAGAEPALLLALGAAGWPGVRHLFGGVPPGVEESVWRAVRRGLARAALLGGAGASGAAGAMAVGKALAFGKGAAASFFGAGAVVGGAMVAGVMLLAGAPAPRIVVPVPVSEIKAPVEVASGAEIDAGAQAVEPATTATPGAVATTGKLVRAAPPVSATATAATSRIDPEEMALIGRAQVAFARKDRAGTLEALDAHARKFPNGAMAHDREGIRAELTKVAGSWPGAPAKNPGVADAGRGRVFGTDD